MKKSYLAVAVLTLTCLLGLGVSAHAQDTEGVVVKVPFEFVAAGKTMPAGKYSIGRISTDASSGLIIRGEKNGALLLPVAVEGPSADQQTLSFDYVGGTYFLSKVKTPGGVYTISLPRAMVALAQMKDQGTISSSGTN
jgi:hypothetical protein